MELSRGHSVVCVVDVISVQRVGLYMFFLFLLLGLSVSLARLRNTACTFFLPLADLPLTFF